MLANNIFVPCPFSYSSYQFKLLAFLDIVIHIVLSYTQCCSSNMEKVKVHPNVHVLTVRLLARNERYSELGLFITNKVFPIFNQCFSVGINDMLFHL